MANYDSILTGAQIESAMTAINGVASNANNGKILCVNNGVIMAKSAIEIQGGTIDAITITENGVYTHPTAGAYSPITVNVGGGIGVIVAAVKANYDEGHVCTATDGTTTLNSNTSGTWLFGLPNSGTWTFTCNGITETFSISNYTFTVITLSGVWSEFKAAATDLRSNGTSSGYYSQMVNKVGEFYSIELNDGTAAKALLVDVLHTASSGSTNEALTFMLCGNSSSEDITGHLSLYPLGNSKTTNNFKGSPLAANANNFIEMLNFYSDVEQCNIYYELGGNGSAQLYKTKSWVWSLNEIGLQDSGYMPLDTGNKFKLLTSSNKNGSPFSITLSGETRTRSAPNNDSSRSYTVKSNFSREFSTSLDLNLGYYPMFSL